MNMEATHRKQRSQDKNVFRALLTTQKTIYQVTRVYCSSDDGL